MVKTKYLFITNSTGYSHKRVCDPFIDYFGEDIELLRLSPKSNPVVIIQNIFYLGNFILKNRIKIKKVIVVGDLFYIGLFFKKKAAYIFDFNILKDASRNRSIFTKLAFRFKCVYPLYFYDELFFFNKMIEDEYKDICFEKKNKQLVYLPVPIHPSFYPLMNYSELLFNEKKEKIRNGKLSVICFGHTENKNLEMALRICQELSNKFSLCVNVVNDKFNICDRFNNIQINRYSDIKDAEIIELYKKSNILLFPSLYEGFGMPIIEAAVSQCLVVTSDLFPMNSLLNSAVLINLSGDISVNIAAIEEGIKNYNNLAINGFKEAMEYHVRKINKLLLY